MSLSEDLLKKLGAKFLPSTMVHFRYRSKDVAVQTDEEGNAVKLFIGKRNDEGNIKGERYARRLIRDRDGNILKDFWDLKGKAS